VLLGGTAILATLHALGDVAAVTGSHKSASTPTLAFALHVFANLSVVQVALALLGPSVPSIDLPVSVLGDRRTKFQLHTLVVLAGGALVLVVEWISRGFWKAQDFDRICVLVDQVLVIVGFISLWYSTQKPSMVSKACLHAHFWKRLVYLALPIVFVVLSAAMYSAHPTSEVSRAMLHVTAAAVSGMAMWIVFISNDFEESEGAPVAQWLLFLPAAIICATVVLTLAGDRFEHSWRWPSLSMAATSRVGAFVLSAAALPLTGAMLLVLALIESAPPKHVPMGVLTLAGVKLPFLQMLHSVACNFARLAFACGVAAAVILNKGKFGQMLHTGFAVMMFTSSVVAVLASALCADRTTVCGKARLTIAACIGFGACIHLTLFLLANRYVLTRFGVTEALSVAYFFSEYLMLALFFAYPITWFDDIQRWQGYNRSALFRFGRNKQGQAQPSCSSPASGRDR
jgi:hypothetical protein